MEINHYNKELFFAGLDSENLVYEDKVQDITYKFGDRKNGKTTRSANRIIELLLNGYKVICVDHYELGLNKFANEKLLNIVKNRLILEHLIKKEEIKVEWVQYVPLISLIK